MWTTGANQLARMFRQEVAERSFSEYVGCHLRVGVVEHIGALRRRGRAGGRLCVGCEVHVAAVCRITGLCGRLAATPQAFLATRVSAPVHRAGER